MGLVLTTMYTTVVYEYPAHNIPLLSIHKLPGMLAFGLFTLVAFPPLVVGMCFWFALLLHKSYS